MVCSSLDPVASYAYFTSRAILAALAEESQTILFSIRIKLKGSTFLSDLLMDMGKLSAELRVFFLERILSRLSCLVVRGLRGY